MTFLKICYGPYEIHGVIQHRFQKLRGVYNCLSNLGYEIELIEVNLLNRLAIEMYDRVIFTCDIQYLLFNMDCDDDVVCEKVVSAVYEANIRMARDENLPKYTPINKGMRHIDELKICNTKDILSQAELWFEYPPRQREIEFVKN